MKLLVKRLDSIEDWGRRLEPAPEYEFEGVPSDSSAIRPCMPVITWPRLLPLPPPPMQDKSPEIIPLPIPELLPDRLYPEELITACCCCTRFGLDELRSMESSSRWPSTSPRGTAGVCHWNRAMWSSSLSFREKVVPHEHCHLSHSQCFSCVFRSSTSENFLLLHFWHASILGQWVRL
ncbi:hypothetical protein MPTK1_2g05470 [Marchantia polymorpha subsp. ruderalis]|uniref:Uncharacterized protein n=1 Tax=Marchantia polymorpha TaxID=3197 RepID=A0A2R6XDD1_MARPO|nr:hypothetical protein MARPO_0021s0003 [Marchantia polymorpha]BBN01198.1 hypothetical protein Mp_2g05470 [Marchantia polymorpha subsp. ruderalis]|eukprot:PTQ44120.1 hypothetical protein MARPO_0021s0003 [Marchantia polymorpha]